MNYKLIISFAVGNIKWWTVSSLINNMSLEGVDLIMFTLSNKINEGGNVNTLEKVLESTELLTKKRKRKQDCHCFKPSQIVDESMCIIILSNYDGYLTTRYSLLQTHTVDELRDISRNGLFLSNWYNPLVIWPSVQIATALEFILLF